MKYIIRDKETDFASFIVGGKARNLFHMKAMGLNVPSWVVIPQETLLHIVPADIQNDFDKSKEYIHQLPIIAQLEEEILNYFPSSVYFAVRSSAIDEDGAEHSFAGQFESYLYVTKENLFESIKKVWLSAFSDRVKAYHANNLIHQKFGIAVIVQQMIDAEVAGVAFGINPANGNRNEKIISAVYGLGEGLVSGELNSDNFIVAGSKITSQLAKKTEQVVLDNQNKKGTAKKSVEIDKQNTACLNDCQIKEIVDILEICKKEYIKPQDIEFAFKENKLYLLQSRPITNLNKIPDINSEYIVWDNSNIIESYPGITSPLTFSFIIKMYEAVYVQFAQLMGVSKKDTDENAAVFANMLGILNGRVYYNLLSWYKALAMLPGYSINAEFMEKMMGVKERFHLEESKTKRSKFKERLRVLNMVFILLKNLRALPKMRIKFQKDFSKIMKEYDAIDFNKCDAYKLMNLYLVFEQTLLKKWKAPLVNDFFAMIYFGVAQKLVIKYKISDNPAFYNDLLCGAKDIISTEPVKRSLEIATQIANDSVMKKLFLENTPAIIWKNLENNNSSIKQLIDEYIVKFGERCVGELKLETITYKQNPLSFIKIIKSYVEQGVTNDSKKGDIEMQLRRDAENMVKSKLSGKPIKKMLFNYFLNKSRDLVSNRENLRYERTRGFGVVREIFCAIGDNFYSEGIIEESRDIFYLTKEEIFDFIKGTSVNSDLKGLINNRKKERTAYESNRTSERIKTYGIVYQGNNFNQKKEQALGDADLKGIGCCPGRVKARVQVIHNPDEVENLNGDILVTSSTDPGWVTLFPTASAILVERGSLLSHSAIVSREMGKPCIVGISNLLDILKTGDMVEMDGSTGEVKIIKS